jgi:NTE family protein
LTDPTLEMAAKTPDLADRASSPVRTIPGDPTEPQQGLALCLSGGGYRAMLFHLGVLWRLNEAGVLPKLDRVSSVSGGSITAGVLALHWEQLEFDDTGRANAFGSKIVDEIRRFASVTVDVGAVLTGVALPFVSVSDRVIRAYRRELFGKSILQDLPDKPTFVFNATNLESGVLFRFSKPYLADYRVGRVMEPDLPVAVAVAASSAFPPILSPCTIDLSKEEWRTDPGNDLVGLEFRDELTLTDGGVYDNLGIETAWKRYRTILVSDGGGHLVPDPDPAHDWPEQMVRVLKVIDNQVRALRKRQIIEAFKSSPGEADHRDGVYVGIRSHVADYRLEDAMPADPKITDELAGLPTRLAAISETQQQRLINWGYTICDTGLRKHVMPQLQRGQLPYPADPPTIDI